MQERGETSQEVTTFGRLSRRRFLGGAGSTALAAAFLVACGSEEPDEGDSAATAVPTESGAGAPQSSEAASGSQAAAFTFTDGRGETIVLDKRPERVVAYAAPAAALWHLGIKPVGIFAGSVLSESPNLAEVDLTGIETVGSVYGEVDLEKLAALRPDLIVTAFSPVQGELTWGFANLEAQATAASIAPIVAINGIEDPTDVIASFEALATAMGADLERPEHVAARERFDAAVADLQEATAAKPGLTAVAITNYDNQLYFAKPSLFPALRQMASWGLNVIEPTGGGESFYETVSFEEANKYVSDLILFDTNPARDLASLAEVGTWQSLPAIEADQIVPWDKLENWSYAAYAADIEAVTAGVGTADPDLVA